MVHGPRRRRAPCLALEVVLGPYRRGVHEPERLVDLPTVLVGAPCRSRDDHRVVGVLEDVEELVNEIAPELVRIGDFGSPEQDPAARRHARRRAKWFDPAGLSGGAILDLEAA